MVPNAFTDAEHKNLAEFINFVFSNAEWKFSSAQCFEFARHYKNATDILKKIEQHVFEVVRTINNNPPSEEEPVKESKKGK